MGPYKFRGESAFQAVRYARYSTEARDLESKRRLIMARELNAAIPKIARSTCGDCAANSNSKRKSPHILSRGRARHLAKGGENIRHHLPQIVTKCRARNKVKLEVRVKGPIWVSPLEYSFVITGRNMTRYKPGIWWGNCHLL